jgi:hypothetical protein
MKITPIFSEYIFEFEYPDHEKYHKLWAEKIIDGNYPVKRKLPQSLKKPVTFTHADLHEIDFFNPIRDFMQQCLSQSMVELGYGEKIKTTAMWATYQKYKDHHPFHYHPNSYLSAIYYCYTDSPGTHGTTFYNPNANRYDVIWPHFDDVNGLKRKFNHHMPFEMGRVVVFVSSTLHSTEVNHDCNRVIIAMNSMPSGLVHEKGIEHYHFWE